MDHSRVDAYLHRIGAERPAAPTAGALRALHHAHLRSVPFENLSVHLDEDVVLAPAALVAKVVDRRRGGFCYELNGAFAALLGALGFEVALLQARVIGEDGRPGIPFDHMALRVRTADGGDRLADVGFGAFIAEPLLFDERGEQRDPGGVFRIEDAPYGDLLVLQDGAAQYLLDPRPRELRDFEGGSWYHRSSPASHFTRSLVCSRPTGDGRITLSGRTLTTTAAGRRTQRTLDSDAAVLAAYEQHFGIVLATPPPEPDRTAD
ncbi:arylamine N-acetyltransferase [Streptomyces sp. NPDC088785]|uniref:arylamine N-acetyltransferase family protein n=1 Tax=Streptomyces sp. NPDC088785 TaxID=3365897 RepID=UPI0037F7E1E8